MQRRNGQSEEKLHFPISEASWAAVEFVRRPHALAQNALVIFLSTCIIGGVVYCNVAKVSITIEAEGRLVTKDPPVPIRSAEKLTIDKLLVVENQKVKKGQVLMNSIESVGTDEIAKIRSYLGQLKAIATGSRSKCRNCIRELEAEAVRYKTIEVKGELVGPVSAVQDASRELLVALEENNVLPTLIRDSRVQLDFDLKKIAEIKRRGAETILAKEFETLTADAASNQAKISDREQKSSERMKLAREKLVSLISDLENKLSYHRTQYIVYAPFDGVVMSLNVKGSGEVVQTGQALLSLTPADSPLIAELEVRNQDISELKQGQIADIKIDAMPEYEYGSVEGAIVEIGRKERDPASDTATLNTPKFVARATLRRQSLSRNGVSEPLITGMTVKADIVARRESIFHLVMRELFQLKDELKATKNEH